MPPGLGGRRRGPRWPPAHTARCRSLGSASAYPCAGAAVAPRCRRAANAAPPGRPPLLRFCSALVAVVLAGATATAAAVVVDDKAVSHVARSAPSPGRPRTSLAEPVSLRNSLQPDAIGVRCTATPAIAQQENVLVPLAAALGAAGAHDFVRLAVGCWVLF